MPLLRHATWNNTTTWDYDNRHTQVAVNGGSTYTCKYDWLGNKVPKIVD
jgi:hypothetical protein